MAGGLCWPDHTRWACVIRVAGRSTPEILVAAACPLRDVSRHPPGTAHGPGRDRCHKADLRDLAIGDPADAQGRHLGRHVIEVEARHVLLVDHEFPSVHAVGDGQAQVGAAGEQLPVLLSHHLLVREHRRAVKENYAGVVGVAEQEPLDVLGPCRAGASLTRATSVSSSSSPMRRRDWSAFITWYGPASPSGDGTRLTRARRSWTRHGWSNVTGRSARRGI